MAQAMIRSKLGLGQHAKVKSSEGGATSKHFYIQAISIKKISLANFHKAAKVCKTVPDFV